MEVHRLLKAPILSPNAARSGVGEVLRGLRQLLAVGLSGQVPWVLLLA